MAEQDLTARKLAVLAVVLALLVSLPAALLPITTGVSFRQAQTAMLTVNYADSGFHLRGLYSDVCGPGKPTLVYELPVLNFLAGLGYKATGANALFGKLFALLFGLASAGLFALLAHRHLPPRIARSSVLFFAGIPIVGILFGAYQPDSIGLAFMAGALLALSHWREAGRIPQFCLFAVLVCLAACIKFTFIVPFAPLLIAMLFGRAGRRVGAREIGVAVVLAIVPFLAWMKIRSGYASEASLEGSKLMAQFFIGDLKRFLAPGTYVLIVKGAALATLGLGGWLLAAAGLTRKMGPAFLLALGIPLFYVIVPTVAYQEYYLLAVAPALALLMARGWSRLADVGGVARMASMALVGLFVLGSALCLVRYLLPETAADAAANSILAHSKPGDLVVFTRTDAGKGVLAGDWPLTAVLSHRRGWVLNRMDDEKTMETLGPRIDSCAAQGARWLSVAEYSAADTPWARILRPGRKMARRSPITRQLMERYPVVEQGDQFVLMSLAPKSGDGAGKGQ